MILGGAVGNLIDRALYGIFFNYAPAFYGKVVDFFDFDFFDFSILGRSYERRPIFNIADASVTVGVLILLFFYKHVKKDDSVVNTATLAAENERNSDVSEKYSEPDTLIIKPEERESENDKADQGKEL